MHTRHLALIAALGLAAGGLGVYAPTAGAQVSIGITVGTPPPPVRYEVVPPPRPGYVWAPGYWTWSGARYVWVGGIWHRARPGYVYYHPRWARDGNHWVMRGAYWGRDPHWRGPHHDNGHHHGWYKDHGDHGHGDDDHGHHGHDHDD
ncbi:MAG: hypothetical protein EPN38_08730 [Rhodanobacteraceae bacterium]|nr:MAG: hypothetical protein EPN38_08730 [Rhodanobacteraceae bacterium]